MNPTMSPEEIDAATCRHIQALLEEGEALGLDGERQCRVCGCTDEAACPDGCEWVEEDLCSNCVEKARWQGGGVANYQPAEKRIEWQYD